jgi:hypothetical protein
VSRPGATLELSTHPSMNHRRVPRAESADDVARRHGSVRRTDIRMFHRAAADEIKQHWFDLAVEHDRKAAHAARDSPKKPSGETLEWKGSIPPPAAADVTDPPNRASANSAYGSSGYADTPNSRPTNSASVGNLRRDAIRLMKRRPWHSLYRCSES